MLATAGIGRLVVATGEHRYVAALKPGVPPCATTAPELQYIQILYMTIELHPS